MKTIYKHAIGVHDDIYVQIPAGGVFLSAQSQNGVLTLWYLVDTEMEKLYKHFQVFGTGSNIRTSSDKLRFLGTVQIDQFVWHVFENTYDNEPV